MACLKCRPALDLLHKPGWPVRIVDRVLHEVTRNATPTSDALRLWFQTSGVTVVAMQRMLNPASFAAR